MKNNYFSILILLVLTSCASLENYVPGLDPTQTATQPARPTPDLVSSKASVTETITPKAVMQHWSVCTGIKDGNLNLRSCAGTGCDVVATLEEGQSLLLTGAKESIGSGSWIYVSSPEKGWVNEHYLCEKED